MRNNMSIFKKLLMVAALSFSALILLANQTLISDITKVQVAFEKETGMPLRKGHHIEPIIFPGFYAVRSGQAEMPSAYFREDMAWLGNVKKQGLVFKSPSDNSPEVRNAWLKEQLSYLPLDKLIFVKRSKPAPVIIWSAPDCGFCRKLERALEQEDVSAYVAPVGISEEGYQQAATVYCDYDPSRAWMAIMQGARNANQPRSSCEYPRDMLTDIGFFFGMGRLATPIVIFADGSTITGWDDKDILTLQDKVERKTFFQSPEKLGLR
jgi:protein disulfide-isomerase